MAPVSTWSGSGIPEFILLSGNEILQSVRIEARLIAMQANCMEKFDAIATARRRGVTHESSGCDASA